MLKIRLQRTGKRGQAYFRVVVLEHTKKLRGEFLELLGNYDPHKKEFKVDMERVNYWVSNGAQVSPTVNNLLVNYKYWDKPKMPSWKPKKKPTTNDQQLTPVPEQSQVPYGTWQSTIRGTATKKETSAETMAEQKPEPTPEVGSSTENSGAEGPKQEEVSAGFQSDTQTTNQ
ncbi:MAG: 30S ribosomal protein S16 [Candidatus Yanofskybacteria bacterium]|nr:30S ribosomal protein S16 [Candidatus Yanofskybacteria bacterium]